MTSYTVTEINDLIKESLNDRFKYQQITVTGEVSNVKHSGKHSFFTLKDNSTQLSVAFWGNNIDNRHGDNVEVVGKIEFYTKNGNINFIGSSIKITGIGSLHTEYEKIKSEYDKKGYFNNKKPLPESVKRIGIVTSEGGAALQDFLYVLEQNKFDGDVYIYDCIVQGNKCPGSVSAGIKFFNSSFYSTFNDNQDNQNDQDDQNDQENQNDKGEKMHDDDVNDDDDDDYDPFLIVPENNHPNIQVKRNTYNDDSDEVEVDLIVVTRGGGSFEDLMGFSHPKIIEAMYASKKYIISAVGHEIDTMLSDYVANYRAPTPSIAGEVVCGINNNSKRQMIELENLVKNVKHEMLQTLYKYKKTLKRIESSIEDPTKQLVTRLNTIESMVKYHIKTKLSAYESRIGHIKEIVESNDIIKVLDHGFVLFVDKKDDIITSINDVVGKEVKMIHHSGRYDITIKKTNDEGIVETKKNKKNS
jgi:exonuclease VII large subunit